MRHSVLRCVFAVGVAACTAQGSDGTQHGPSYDDAGGVDATAGDGALVDAAPRDAAGDASSDATSGDASAGGDASVVDGSTVDAGADASADAGAVDASACTSSMVVLAGGASALAGASFSHGQWSAASSIAGSAATPIAVAPLGTLFVGVTVGESDRALHAVTFGGAWSAPSAVGQLASRDTPWIAAVGNALHLVFQADAPDAGADYKYFHGVYAAGSWDAANDPVGGAGASQSFGARGPSAASVGGKLVLAQAGSDGIVYDQTLDVTWQAAHAESATSVENVIPPTIVAMNGGAADTMIVYARKLDRHLMFTTRAAGAWSVPTEVYAASNNIAFSNAAASVAPLAGGGAVLAYMGTDGKPYFSVYASGSWSAPAPLVGSMPTLASPPALAPGVCGYDAVAAYADAAGSVSFVALAGSSWTAPVAISGASGMSYVGIATLP